MENTPKKLLVNNTNCVEHFGNYMQITLESNKIFDPSNESLHSLKPSMQWNRKVLVLKIKVKQCGFICWKKLETFMETSFVKREEFIFLRLFIQINSSFAL